MATSIAIWLFICNNGSAAAISYTYDSLNRLVEVGYGNGSVISYTYDSAGNRLIYFGVVANDTAAPTISITNPTSGPNFSTSNATVNLSGIASDNAGVSLITWGNDRGGIGIASGTSSWTINGLHLQTGANLISVTANDAAGNSSQANVTVTLLPQQPLGQLSVMSLSNGVFRCALSGPVGSNYVIQVSSNLVDWLPLVTYVIPESGFIVVIDPAIGQPKRFYRAFGGTTSVAPANMALIPAGSFTMGNSIGDSDEDILDANPISTVTLSAFYMDSNLVSLSQWQSVYSWATNHDYSFVNAGLGKGADHPVQTVNWYDVVKWCNARSQQEGRTPVYYTDSTQTTIYRTGEIDITIGCVKWTASGYRLPTEAEWEKAARGGLTGQRFPWGNVINQTLANYYGYTARNSYDLGPDGYNPIGSIGGTSPATSPVGSFPANGYGLYDMAGNVLQWCWDWKGSYSASPSTDPRGPVSGSRRVSRGGSWAGAGSCVWRTAYRYSHYPSFQDIYFGFRCVLPPGQ